jgi:hypothetical protein
MMSRIQYPQIWHNGTDGNLLNDVVFVDIDSPRYSINLMNKNMFFKGPLTLLSRILTIFFTLAPFS